MLPDNEETSIAIAIDIISDHEKIHRKYLDHDHSQMHVHLPGQLHTIATPWSWPSLRYREFHDLSQNHNLQQGHDSGPTYSLCYMVPWKCYDTRLLRESYDFASKMIWFCFENDMFFASKMIWFLLRKWYGFCFENGMVFASKMIWSCYILLPGYPEVLPGYPEGVFGG